MVSLFDIMYTLGKGHNKQYVMIIEMKRSLVDIRAWMGEKQDIGHQGKLSRELRGSSTSMSQCRNDHS